MSERGHRYSFPTCSERLHRHVVHDNSLASLLTCCRASVAGCRLWTERLKSRAVATVAIEQPIQQGTRFYSSRAHGLAYKQGRKDYQISNAKHRRVDSGGGTSPLNIQSINLLTGISIRPLGESVRQSSASTARTDLWRWLDQAHKACDVER